MGDTAALLSRINELEEALANASSFGKEETFDREELEQQLVETEAALEGALLERVALERTVEEYKLLLEDTKLQATAQILEKDLQLVSAEIDINSTAALRKQLAQKNEEIEALKHEVQEYTTGFDKLKQWCVDSAKATREAEFQITDYANRITELSNQLIEAQFFVKEQTTAVNAYKELSLLDAQLLSSSAELENALQERIHTTQKELASYKEAFTKLSKMIVEKEAQTTSQTLAMSARIEELQAIVQRNAAFLAPRWQRLVSEKTENKIGSKAAAILKSRDGTIISSMLQAENQFFLSCITPEIWSVEVHIHSIAATLVRLIYKSDNFIDYVFQAHYKDLVADVQENPLSVKKDVSFIRWLHESVYLLCNVLSKLSQILEAFRHLPLKTLIKLLRIKNSAVADSASTGEAPIELNEEDESAHWSFGTATSTLKTCLDSGERHLDQLLESAENDYLSAIYDLSVFDTFLQNLNAAEAEMQSAELPENFISPVRRVEKSSEYGILAPVLSAAARRFASLAVLGLCGAAYTESANKAIASEVWIGLWDAANHLVEWIPFGRNTTLSGTAAQQADCLTVGFGILKPSKRANDRESVETFVRNAKIGYQQINNELCATAEAPVADITARISKQLPIVGNALQKLANMCRHFVATRKSEKNVAPWDEAVEIVLRRMCGATAMQQELDRLRRRQQRIDEDLKKATEDVIHARQETNAWQAKYADIRLHVERMSLLEPEIKERRATEAHYSRLIASQRLELDQLNLLNKKIVEEETELKAKLTEAHQILELTKTMPRQQNQSEWDTMEIDNLQNINKKLEREIFAIQMEKVEKELDPSDLEIYLPPSSLQPETQTLETVEQVPESIRESTITTKNNGSLTADKSTVTFPTGAPRLQSLIADYRAIQSAIMQHFLRVPIINPTSSSAQNSACLKKYVAEHSALRMKLSVLRHKIDALSTGLGRATCGESTFGLYTGTAGSRYRDALSISEKTQPTMKIVVPHAPWPVNSPSTRHSSVCKLSATSHQLRALEKKLLDWYAKNVLHYAVAPTVGSIRRFRARASKSTTSRTMYRLQNLSASKNWPPKGPESEKPLNQAARKELLHHLNTLEVERMKNLQPFQMPELSLGDLVEVRYELSRTQQTQAVFQGYCVEQRKNGLASCFILKNTYDGIGVTQLVPKYSPRLLNVRVVHRPSQVLTTDKRPITKDHRYKWQYNVRGKRRHRDLISTLHKPGIRSLEPRIRRRIAKIQRRYMMQRVSAGLPPYTFMDKRKLLTHNRLIEVRAEIQRRVYLYTQREEAKLKYKAKRIRQKTRWGVYKIRQITEMDNSLNALPIYHPLLAGNLPV